MTSRPSHPCFMPLPKYYSFSPRRKVPWLAVGAALAAAPWAATVVIGWIVLNSCVDARSLAPGKRLAQPSSLADAHGRRGPGGNSPAIATH